MPIAAASRCSCVAISMFFITLFGSCQSLSGAKLSCHIGSGNKGTLFPGQDLLLSCYLEFNGTHAVNNIGLGGVSKATFGRIKTTITNSTFRKVSEWRDLTNDAESWKFTIKHLDLFESYSDFELPKRHLYSSLKWTLETEFRSPFIPKRLTHTTTVSYVTTDPTYRFDWGSPIVDITQPSFVSDYEERIYVNVPCQPGSGLLILSSHSQTIIAASWDAFRSAVRWFDATILLASAAAANESPIVYQATFSSGRLFLATSSGVLASSSFSSMCWDTDDPRCRKISFTKRVLPAELSDVTWSSSELVHYPACSNMDEIQQIGDQLFLKIRMENGTVRVFELVHPSKDWSFVNDFPPHASHTTISYDSHSRMHAAYVDEGNESKAYVTSFINSRRYVWMVSDFQFSLPGFLPLRSVSLSSIFVFLIGNSSILASSDGGLSYSQLYHLSSGEKVLSLASHDRMKSVAFLLDSGMILVMRAGLERMIEITPDVNFPSFVNFDNDGSLHALKIDVHAPENFPQIISEPVDFNTNEECSLSLVPHQPDLVDSLIFLDVGDEFVWSAAAYSNPSRSDTKLPLLSAAVSNPKLLQTNVELTTVTHFQQRIYVTIRNAGHIQGTGAVTIMLKNAEESCHFTSVTVSIAFSCPPTKHLVFDYSSFVEPEHLLSVEKFVNLSASFNTVRLLEKNYRPPSALGISIPLSKNIYNYDSKSPRNALILDYKFDETFGIAEHCEGKEYTECDCSSAMKFSSLEKYSNCRERVYEVKYETDYFINVSVVDEADYTNTKFTEAEYLIFLEEVNGRGEEIYAISDGNNRLCTELTSHGICNQYSNEFGEDYSAKTNEYMSYSTGKDLYNSTTLVLKFMGTGLFHFRVVLSRGYSHCRLQDEFQVYVTNPPLPFPVGTIVRLAVSVAMGAALAIIYMRTLANNVTRKVAPAESIFVSEETTQIRRINASLVDEDDLVNLRNKFRSSFQASLKPGN